MGEVVVQRTHALRYSYSAHDLSRRNCMKLVDRDCPQDIIEMKESAARQQDGQPQRSWQLRRGATICIHQRRQGTKTDSSHIALPKSAAEHLFSIIELVQW